MSEIKISLADVASTASKLRYYNSNLDDILASVNKLMNDLNNVWDSESEETLLGRFRHFAQKFLNESDVIESYAKFLDNTVASYDSLESTIVSNASNFN